eukprot:TRINITY_DN1079_c0_g1_i1.p1 TRINITY_DN1079_c0_g1~~TRINITY_DN1079_c0_g1_i1.p1  ORF type:complete len:517 (+),score=154.36 TRINITY_DN1079_c0_g1_i1:102-1553(+)
MSADIGLIGLAVMGENLVLNMESKGFTVAVHNRTTSKVDDFVNGRGKGKKFVGCHTVEDLCKNLKKPRIVMMMVRAGSAVDEQIEKIVPFLEKGDIIVDGGNSHYPDTTRRQKELEKKGFLFVGCGVSGGEEGALNGPSMMPGGSEKAWPVVKPIFQAIAAKVEDGAACCEWVGDEGAGHFVKMVHNGIEYGDMQLISEAYQFLKEILGLDNEAIADVMDEWNKGDLDSYLIEITRDIFRHKEDDGKTYTLDLIQDTAGQKGTGKWTVMAAADMGIPLTMVGEAVFARCVSALRNDRLVASKALKGPKDQFTGDKKDFINSLRDAVYASKIVSYAQGYLLMRAAANEYKWKINYGDVALMWRGGCIIRSTFLAKIKAAFDSNPDLQNILLDQYFVEKVSAAQPGWRKVVATAVTLGVPVPGISSALSYFDGLRTERLPANLLQAQRDYFGAHTYERIDKKAGEFFHTNWTGRGGSTHSSTYTI